MWFTAPRQPITGFAVSAVDLTGEVCEKNGFNECGLHRDLMYCKNAETGRGLFQYCKPYAFLKNYANRAIVRKTLIINHSKEG